MRKYSCDKCGHSEYETGEFRAVGGGVTRLFNIQNKKFHTVSCMRCGYTEIFRATSSTAGNVVDFMFG